jgi:hypothetical protein
MLDGQVADVKEAGGAVGQTCLLALIELAALDRTRDALVEADFGQAVDGYEKKKRETTQCQRNSSYFSQKTFEAR